MNKVMSDAERKKLVQDDPLIMPAHHTSRSIEHLFLFGSGLADPIHDAIMKMQER
jgi:hypothetical protein